MDRTLELTQILQREVADYARPAIGGKAFYVENPTEQVYAVLAVLDSLKGGPFFVVLARIEDGKVIIEADNTGSPLYDALTAAGIPADLIIEAYVHRRPMVAPPTP
jgi:hypothetical protein